MEVHLKRIIFKEENQGTRNKHATERKQIDQLQIIPHMTPSDIR